MNATASIRTLSQKTQPEIHADRVSGTPSHSSLMMLGAPRQHCLRLGWVGLHRSRRSW